MDDVIPLSESREGHEWLPITTKVIFPDSYDEKRTKPYPMVIASQAIRVRGVDYMDGYYHALEGYRQRRDGHDVERFRLSQHERLHNR